MRRARSVVLLWGALAACDDPSARAKRLPIIARAERARALAAASGQSLAPPPTAFLTEGPAIPSELRIETACALDRIGDREAADVSSVSREHPVALVGWAANPALGIVPDALLELAGEKRYYAPVRVRSPRADVAAALRNPALGGAGFVVPASLAAVPRGDYRLSVLSTSEGGVTARCDTGRILRVE